MESVGARRLASVCLLALSGAVFLAVAFLAIAHIDDRYGVSAAPEAAAGGGNLMGGMPLAGTRAGFGNGLGPRYGFKPTVMGRPPIGG